MERIKKGDTVEIISGEHKGKRGQVRSVYPGQSQRHGVAWNDANKDTIVVAGINLIKKHQRRTGDVRTQIGIIEREAPIAASQVALVCKNCDQATKVGTKVFEDGSKARYCKRCGENIE